MEGMKQLQRGETRTNVVYRWSWRTFFFHMDPLASGWGPGFYLWVSEIGPPVLDSRTRNKRQQRKQRQAKEYDQNNLTGKSVLRCAHGLTMSYEPPS